MVSMAVLLHLMMTFASRHREEFLELERQFAALEATPAINPHQPSLDRRWHAQSSAENHKMLTQGGRRMYKSLSMLCRLLLLSLSGLSTTTVVAAVMHSERWIGTWSSAPEAESNMTGMLGKTDVTYREIVHLSVGGPAVRLVLTNEFGKEPLTISAVNIALSAGGNAIKETTLTPVRFEGQTSVTLPAGTAVVSDPIDFKVTPLSNLVVSFSIPVQPLSQITAQTYSLQTNYMTTGNMSTAPSLTAATELTEWPFLRGVEVKSNIFGASIVALGDSITAGAASQINENRRWTDELARRLQEDKALSSLGVLNSGINGNRVLHDGEGDQSALGRFDRDVLSQPGVKYLIILEGINDIGHITSPIATDPAATSESILNGLKQMVLRAHIQGLKVIGGTILPYENCKYYSQAGEAMRQNINRWIRRTHDLDGFVDFDEAIRDPAHPSSLLPAFDSGDHLHPNTSGLNMMGDRINLRLFRNR
jgi:lysophospholipase L1-like esterase